MRKGAGREPGPLSHVGRDEPPHATAYRNAYLPDRRRIACRMRAIGDGERRGPKDADRVEPQRTSQSARDHGSEGIGSAQAGRVVVWVVRCPGIVIQAIRRSIPGGSALGRPRIATDSYRSQPREGTGFKPRSDRSRSQLVGSRARRFQHQAERRADARSQPAVDRSGVNRWRPSFPFEAITSSIVIARMEMSPSAARFSTARVP